MARRTQGTIKHGDTQLYVWQVRNELHDIWNSLLDLKNSHLAAFAPMEMARREKHPEDCKVCRRWDDEIHGVRRALYRFGSPGRRFMK